MPVLSHVLNAAIGVDFGEIFVVSKTRVAEEISWVRNENPEFGQGHSLRLGLAAAQTSEWETCVVLLGDMPLISSSYINEFIQKSEFNQSIVSLNGSTRMPPALFTGEAIEMILSRKSALGARELFDVLDLITVKLDGHASRDVDTPEDLASVVRIMEARRT
jgi:CTP:molybdopterin cytidylyltransferase MocA